MDCISQYKLKLCHVQACLPFESNLLHRKINKDPLLQPQYQMIMDILSHTVTRCYSVMNLTVL